MQESSQGADANNKDGAIPSMVKRMIDRITNSDDDCTVVVADANESID